MKALLATAVGTLLLTVVVIGQTFTYLDRANLAGNADFRKRVEVAMVKVCLAVLEEDPATVNHELKVTLARRLLTDTAASAIRLSPLIVNHALVTSDTVTDANLQTAVTQTLVTLAENNILTRW